MEKRILRDMFPAQVDFKKIIQSIIHFHQRPLFILAFILSSIIFSRALLFTAQHGAIEHDSGWYMGEALNLGLHGKYASLLSTGGKYLEGVVPGIHGRPVVQAPDGSNYFSAGITVGPGYVIPQAIFYRLFGDGLWAGRIWPLLSYAGLIYLSFIILARFSGVWGQILFFLFLYVWPKFHIQFSWEAYSEQTTLFYILLSMLCCYKRKMFLGALILGLSVQTKLLAVLLFPSFYLFAFYYYFFEAKTSIKKNLIGLITFALLTLGPTLLYELFRLLTLTISYGWEAYQANNQDFLMHFHSGGGQSRSLGQLTLDHFLGRLNIWNLIGIYGGSIMALVLLILPFVSSAIERKNKDFFWPLFLFSLIIPTLLWFCIFNQGGWFRHFWMAAYFQLLVLFLYLGRLPTIIPVKSLKIFSLVVSLHLLYLIFNPGQGQEHRNLNFFLTKDDIHQWNSQRGIAGLPALATFDLDDQIELVNWAKTTLMVDDLLFYEGGLLVAEATALLHRPLHSLVKLKEMKLLPGKKIFIMGPYQVKQNAPYRLRDDKYLNDARNAYCQEPLFKNQSYELCLLRDL